MALALYFYHFVLTALDLRADYGMGYRLLLLGLGSPTWCCFRGYSSLRPGLFLSDQHCQCTLMKLHSFLDGNDQFCISKFLSDYLFQIITPGVNYSDNKLQFSLSLLHSLEFFISLSQLMIYN